MSKTKNKNMKKDIKNIIPKPCIKNWSEMEITDNPLIKKCNLCNKNVFDIRNFDDNQISDLFFQNNKNLCVFADTKKINNFEINNSIRKVINKFSYLGLIFASSLFTSNLQAQCKKKLNTYVIEQKDLQSDTIQIEGIIKGEYKKGLKRIKDFSINIYSEDKLIKELIVDKKGKFKISINKSQGGEKISISINAYGYNPIRIEDIKKKNTFIEVFMEKKIMSFVTGRYF
jgi:hypothetical protein